MNEKTFEKTVLLSLAYIFVSAVFAVAIIGDAHATGSVHHNNNTTNNYDQSTTLTNKQFQAQGQAQGQFQNASAKSKSNSVGVGLGVSSSVSQGGSGFGLGVGGNSASTSSTGDSISSSSSGSYGGGSSTNVNVSANTAAPDLSNAVGAAIAPPVYNSMITCMGGVSAGGGFAGGAFSLGTSIESDDCNVRQDAMLVKDDPEVFKAVVCQSPRIKEAYRIAGRPCLDKPATLTAAQAKANSEAKMRLLAERHAKQALGGL